jgi:hypothetical protein
MFEIAIDFKLIIKAKRFILSVLELEIMLDFRSKVDCGCQNCTKTCYLDKSKPECQDKQLCVYSPCRIIYRLPLECASVKATAMQHLVAAFA